jgi:hypothetical protein
MRYAHLSAQSDYSSEEANRDLRLLPAQERESQPDDEDATDGESERGGQKLDERVSGGVVGEDEMDVHGEFLFLLYWRCEE